MPLVSIILPNLNALPFLTERFASIQAQTFRDWELIAVDGFSDDGSWEFIQLQAAQDQRIRSWQVAREGAYPAWNRGIREARGELIYIATADDSMTSNFLEKMVTILGKHPECDIAHCCLTVMDEESNPIVGSQSWQEQPAQKFYFGEWLKKAHIRFAPHDGFLHAATGTVYTSINQLLIRRHVFENAGYFRADLGPGGDFEWGMRVSLLHSTVYVPEYLASWRRHPGQLTQDAASATPIARRHMAQMIELAVSAATNIDPQLCDRLNADRLTQPMRHQAMLLEREGSSWPGLIKLIRQWWHEPDLIGLDLKNHWLWKQKFHRCHLRWVRNEMKRKNVPGIQSVRS